MYTHSCSAVKWLLPALLYYKTKQNSIMAQQGATLQNTNNQLVKCIEELRLRRDEVSRLIIKEVSQSQLM